MPIVVARPRCLRMVATTPNRANPVYRDLQLPVLSLAFCRIGACAYLLRWQCHVHGVVLSPVRQEALHAQTEQCGRGVRLNPRLASAP